MLRERAPWVRTETSLNLFSARKVGQQSEILLVRSAPLGMTNHNETLLPAPKSLLAQRNQHHAAARSGLRPPDYFHDHYSPARKQHEPGYSIEQREKSGD